MKVFSLIGALLSFFLCGPLRATEAADLGAAAATSSDNWSRGLSALSTGENAAAERAFSLHLDQGFVGAEVYYNLGLSQAAQGKTAEAVLSYLRALAIDPQLSSARAALDHLARQQGLTLPRLNQPQIWTGLIGTTPFWIAGSILGWVGLGLLAWGIFRPRPRAPWMVPGVLATLVAGASLAVAQLGDPLVSNAGMAVVLQPSGDKVQSTTKALPLRSNPVDTSAGLEQLKPGSIVGIISARGRWTLVQSLSGKSGWVPSESIQAVLPTAPEK